VLRGSNPDRCPQAGAATAVDAVVDAQCRLYGIHEAARARAVTHDAERGLLAQRRVEAELRDTAGIAAIDRRRTEWRDRIWLLREKTGAEIWRLARKILELRHLLVPAERWRSDLFDGSGVPVIEEAWQWNPNEKLLRDYYANSLLTFAEVKRRGWPERPKSREQIEASAARAAAEAAKA